MKQTLSRLLAHLRDPGWKIVLAVFAIFAASLGVLLASFSLFPSETLVNLLSPISGIAFFYLVYVVVIKAMDLYRNKIKPAYMHTRLGDFAFRTYLFGFFSFSIGVVMGVGNLITFMRTGSWFFLTMATWYLILAFMRGWLLIYSHVLNRKGMDPYEAEKRRWKASLLSGCLLLFLDIAMGGTITAAFMLNEDTGSGFIMAIANAAYTFYKFIAAFVQASKGHRQSNPIAASIRDVNLADAIYSMVSLTVTMLNVFGDNDLSIGTGVAPWAIVALVVISGVSIVRNVQGVRRLQNPRLPVPYGKNREG